MEHIEKALRVSELSVEFAQEALERRLAQMAKDAETLLENLRDGVHLSSAAKKIRGADAEIAHYEAAISHRETLLRIKARGEGAE